jgi:hypothetical protein
MLGQYVNLAISRSKVALLSASGSAHFLIGLLFDPEDGSSIFL